MGSKPCYGKHLSSFCFLKKKSQQQWAGLLGCESARMSRPSEIRLRKKIAKKYKKTTHVEIRHANIDKSILNISKNIFCHPLLDSLEQKEPRMLKQVPAVPTEGHGFKALL